MKRKLVVLSTVFVPSGDLDFQSVNWDLHEELETNMNEYISNKDHLKINKHLILLEQKLNFALFLDTETGQKFVVGIAYLDDYKKS